MRQGLTLAMLSVAFTTPTVSAEDATPFASLELEGSSGRSRTWRSRLMEKSLPQAIAGATAPAS
jgi:hypothetical protein